MTESCRLVTTEQYQEYLKLKEEHKPISWEELKEEAKKMGYVQITGFPNYFINRNGEIMNKHFKKIKQTLSFQGYWRVGLWKNGKLQKLLENK